MTAPNISITTFPEMEDLAFARVDGAANFQFYMNDLHGRLLEDFLKDFNILEERWVNGGITGYRTFVPLDRLQKWQEMLRS